MGRINGNINSAYARADYCIARITSSEECLTNLWHPIGGTQYAAQPASPDLTTSMFRLTLLMSCRYLRHPKQLLQDERPTHNRMMLQKYASHELENTDRDCSWRCRSASHDLTTGIPNQATRA
ncbi:hypothetical protein O9993_15765 [Vibrio lentus]|nr:hypothetical protein [Vibrio lentus]